MEDDCPYCGTREFPVPLKKVGEDECYFHFVCELCNREFFKAR